MGHEPLERSVKQHTCDRGECFFFLRIDSFWVKDLHGLVWTFVFRMSE
jgi:hypothetical protein